MTREKEKKCFRPSFVVPILCSVIITSAMIKVQSVSARTEDEMPVYSVVTTDPYLNDTLKTEMIEKHAQIDPNIVIDDVDFDRSTLTIQGLDPNAGGIQSVTLRIRIARKDDDIKNIGYTFKERAVVHVQQGNEPILRLKDYSVTVNNNDTFNPFAYVTMLSDDSGILPVITETNNVDTSKDGIYYAVYTAYDNEGNQTTAVMNVKVQTHQDMALEEQYGALTEDEMNAEDLKIGKIVYGRSGANPYGGGWANCTFGAWQAVYESTGIKLPNFGNAGAWLNSAKRYDYGTGRVPVVGSVAVYSHHVAYVTAVSKDGKSVQITEGGYNGHANKRWVSAKGTGSQALKGYIYLK